jgi:hypothetical protein
MDDERIWCVRSYPDGKLLHTELSYDDCDGWRHANNEQRSFIVPSFFDLT